MIVIVFYNYKFNYIYLIFMTPAACSPPVKSMSHVKPRPIKGSLVQYLYVERLQHAKVLFPLSVPFSFPHGVAWNLTRARGSRSGNPNIKAGKTFTDIKIITAEKNVSPGPNVPGHFILIL